MFMKRYSYKAGIVFGLSLAAFGGFMFFPAAMVGSYGVYLCVFFIIATGMCFLETAANPYVTVLGSPDTAVRRLNLDQSFNGLGAFISAMFLSKLVLSGNNYTRDTLPAGYEGGWEAYIQHETEAMRLPYLALGLLLVVVALVFVMTKFPKIADEQDGADGAPGGNGRQKLIDFSVLKQPNLCWGVIAQFFYNGGQTAINSLFLVGRWVGTALMVRFSPQHMLLFYSLMLMALCVVICIFGGHVGLYAMLAVSFFMSIIYPTQFSMALQGLGAQTKSGSAFLVMAIVGNACLPQFTAYVMHVNEDMYHIAYLVPMVCFAFCAYYGWRRCRRTDSAA